MRRAETSGKRAKPRPKSAQERVRSLRGVFGSRENVLVLINPDPDSMASALAVKRLLWKQVGKTVIARIREIERLENQAMMELLKIPIVSIDKVDPESFTRRVLVDAQPDHSEIFNRYAYDVIIDHHPITKKWKARYVDIRPEYGATSTILTEYLRGARIKPSMNLATALLYAIKADTANFERDAAEEDVKEFRYLYPYANSNLLRKVEQSELKISDLHYFQDALKNVRVSRKALYAHVGEVPSGDICVQIADFFMRVYGMGWSFVSGVHNDTLIIIIRNDGYRKDAGKLVAKAFGALGSAGGHRGAARAEISLDTLRQKGLHTEDHNLERFVRGRLRL
jgi:nanoRNase/pAp phosphatase (c-di-AMP/oligoRNAs hydrolase)